ncbi:MAG: hypothetical protein M3P11_00145 [Actinomycetota bacterium]|nr:hypothetical protein [Actinomycetota bacterium]
MDAKDSNRNKAAIGAAIAILGGLITFLSTLDQLGRHYLSTKLLVGVLVQYWAGPVLLVVGGSLGMIRRAWLGFSAGICIAAGISALGLAVRLNANRLVFGAGLDRDALAGPAIGILGGFMLTMACRQVRRADVSSTVGGGTDQE